MTPVQELRLLLSFLHDEEYRADPAALEAASQAVFGAWARGEVPPWADYPRAGRVFAALGWFNLGRALGRRAAQA